MVKAKCASYRRAVFRACMEIVRMGQWGLQERAVIWSGRYAAASLAGIAEGVMMKVGGQLDK
jgi:hypothetical protein